MRRYLPLLLFIGLAWGQINEDSLKLNSGSSYIGEYIETLDDSIVVFKPLNSPSKQFIRKALVSELKLKDGQYVIGFDQNIVDNDQDGTFFSNDKIGKAMIGSGALLIASAHSERMKYTSEYTQQELEQRDEKYVVDEFNSKRVRALIGSLLIAFGSFIQLLAD